LVRVSYSYLGNSRSAKERRARYEANFPRRSRGKSKRIHSLFSILRYRPPNASSAENYIKDLRNNQAVCLPFPPLLIVPKEASAWAELIKNAKKIQNIAKMRIGVLQ
jgi:hypothetical protein